MRYIGRRHNVQITCGALELLSICIEALQWSKLVKAPLRKLIEIIREGHGPREILEPIPLDFIDILNHLLWVVVELPEDFID